VQSVLRRFPTFKREHAPATLRQPLQSAKPGRLENTRSGEFEEGRSCRNARRVSSTPRVLSAENSDVIQPANGHGINQRPSSPDGGGFAPCGEKPSPPFTQELFAL